MLDRQIFGIVCCLLVAAVSLSGQTGAASAESRGSAKTTPAASASPASTLTFDATCSPGRRATIAAVGDLLFHDALQAQALQPGQSFRPFWGPVARVLADADLTYGNLESPLAEGVRPGGYAHKDPGRVLDRVVYGRRGEGLVFNTHPSVATDLAASGFDIVSTANNHSADRGALGIDRTLSALSAAGLATAGTRRSDAAGPSGPFPWSTRTTTANGLTVAWLACTYGLNGMPDPKAQVLHCYRDRDAVLDEVRALAADPTVDATILTPHWGAEGAPRPLASDKVYARDAIDAGATAVIGTHPHVLQPWEKHTTAAGRDGLIIYSTGNFISNQKSDDQRTGIIALLELTKPDDGMPARLSAAGYIPTYVEMSGDRGHRVTELSRSNDATRRLPPGNRVTLSTYRTLPRACAPTAPEQVAKMTPPASPAPPPIITAAWYDALLPAERVVTPIDVAAAAEEGSLQSDSSLVPAVPQSTAPFPLDGGRAGDGGGAQSETPKTPPTLSLPRKGGGDARSHRQASLDVPWGSSAPTPSDIAPLPSSLSMSLREPSRRPLARQPCPAQSCVPPMALPTAPPPEPEPAGQTPVADIVVGLAPTIPTRVLPDPKRVIPGAAVASALPWSPPTPPQRTPTRNDPLRAGRLRLEGLALLATPDPTLPRVQHHVPLEARARPAMPWAANLPRAARRNAPKPKRPSKSRNSKRRR